MKKTLIALSFLSLGAATPQTFHLILPQKSTNYISEGIFVGGKTGVSFSLLNLYRQRFKNKPKERWIFSLGDKKEKPLEKIPYIQVSLKKNKQLLVSLFQVHKSRIEKEHIQKLVRKSPYIKTASILFEPDSGVTHILFDLKKPLKMGAFENPQKKGQLVLDILPL